MPGVFDLYASITLNSDGYKKELNEAAQATGQAAKNIGAKTVAIGTLMADMVKQGGRALIKMAKTGIEYNAQIETYTSALTTALGSEAEAAAAIEQIKIDAAKTPYSVDGLVKANSYLISAGESAQSARATIMALSDAVSATGGGNAELQRMAQNLQQVKNVGKATSMDIRQFAMAGIDIYGLLADYTGKTTAEVQDLDVSYDLLSAALRNAAAEGGRFYQANARQSATMNGQISTLSDNVTAKLGEAFASVSETISGKVLPAVNDFVEGIDVDKVVSAFQKLAKVVGVVGAAVAAQKVANIVGGWHTEIVKVVASYMEFTQSMMIAQIEQAALNGEMTAGQVVAGVLAGDISLATAAQVAWNAAVAAFPAALIIGAVAALGTVLVKTQNALDDIRQSATQYGETSEEVGARIEQLTAQYDAWETALLTGEGEAVSAWRMDQTAAEIDGLKTRYAELVAAEETAAASAGNHSAALSSMGHATELAMAVTDEFKVGLDSLVDTYTQTYNDISKRVNGWYGLFDKAKGDVKRSIKEMTDAMQSQITFNTGYSENLNKIATYGLPEVGAAFQQMGADGAGYAEALVQAVESAGGATSEGGQKIIADFEAMSQGVTKSRTDLSEALTNVTGDFEAAFASLTSSAEAAVAGMDLSADAKSAAISMINAYVSGISSGGGRAEAAAAGVAAAAARGLSIGKGRVGHGAVSVPLFASGTDYIPYDNFPAVLHKGEMVVPAKISEDLRDFVKNGSTTGGSIPAAPATSSGEIISLLRELIEVTRRPVVLNSGALVGGIGYDMDHQLGGFSDMEGRGLCLA